MVFAAENVSHVLYVQWGDLKRLLILVAATNDTTNLAKIVGAPCEDLSILG